MAKLNYLTAIWVMSASVLVQSPNLQAEQPTVAAALKLVPIQKNIDFDRPTGADTKKCTIGVETLAGASGWVVRSETGATLRRFRDTNRDNKVDQWCYFKDGIEIYRDIDANFNGKADQYRWLGTAGIRWGIDNDEDGRIDSWKAISPEEVSAEVVAAVRDRNKKQFLALLLTEKELKSLKLGKTKTSELGKIIVKAKDDFENSAKRQTTISTKSKWIHFGGSQPGVIPAGTEGSESDVVVYDNIAAVIESDNGHSQVAVGSLIKVGDVWRVIDLPHNLLTDADAAPRGYFFLAKMANRPAVDNAPAGGVDQQIQELVSQLDKIDRALATAASAAEKAKLNAQRANVVEKIAQGSEGEDQLNWIRQLADSVSAAVQTGGYPQGIERLKQLFAQLEKDKRSTAQIGYVKFRYLTAEYGQQLHGENVDYAKVQENWLKNLSQFVKDFPAGEDAADAMLQLAIAEEFANNTTGAIKWYDQLIKQFPNSPLSAKASGATRRLNSIGKTITLKGRTLGGKTVDLAQFRGKYVVIHYWATWCEPCKDDMKKLKSLQAKYAKRPLALLGVNVDGQRSEALQYARDNRITWSQMFEDGGLDSPLANHLGVLTLPTMLLLDKEGKVVNRNLHGGDIEDELEKLLK